ncbi:hypothetical protein MKW98_014647 [Papaver atlanticum]|uniref:NusG-like N-terminal domain-containing protein n=1 Tax=Papaver atlanticum TaxID=357466 RepID=A0AAD4SHA6_9MAGN|nr:hypothetical protein MKW98_014647 [Papaver atlanticum]
MELSMGIGYLSLSHSSSTSSSLSRLYPIPCLSVLNRKNKINLKVSSAILQEEEESGGDGGFLTGRERRQLRNERRASTTNNWREEVEDKLLGTKFSRKRFATWTEELNLDNLALLGPQWWVVRVSRVSGQETADVIGRTLNRKFPNIDFKIYAPAVRVKRKLKNGSITVKPKPLFPGCVFLWCVLNKEIHDFIRDTPGVGGFIGSTVGNTKKQINRPKPVSSNDMEAIFRRAKEEQVQTDQAFEEEQKVQALANEGEPNPKPKVIKKSVTADAKRKKRTKKGAELAVENASLQQDDKLLVPGSSVRIVSGPFMEFTGNLKKLDRKTGKAIVGFMLFGKESLVDVDANQIAVEGLEAS